MEQKLTRELKIGAGRCDSSGRLGMYETFSVFMDHACEHADLLGCGLNDMMQRGLLWVAVRSMVRFAGRPAMGEDTILTTWPLAPGRTTSERDYILTDRDGNVLCEGKTEWTVIDAEKGRIVSPKSVFGEDMSFCEEAVDLPAFSRFRTDPAVFRPMGSYRCASTDCDVEGHMNNTAYIRMMCAAVSTEEWKKLDTKIMEAYFASQVREGDILSLYRYDEEGMIVFRAADSSGKSIFWM
ncbi:MAG: hypothetical protein J5822_08890, partial [Eubacteriaceae bacterium]|nr:hypothetical protein [Eubacteriaceae bacterium]